MAYDSSSVRALLTELQASSEACALIYKAASEEEAGAAASLDNEAAQNFMARPPSISDVVETARSLFATCQDGSCASADVTLALRGAADAEAVLQQVHRCILSARCPFFQALFSDLWTKPATASLEVATEECSGSQAVLVIEYLYTGSVDVDVSIAAEVMSLANLWQLPDLVDTIMSQLTKDPCSNFRRPNGPSDELLVNVPSMASFAAAAVEGGIEHDSVTSLYQSCVAWMARHALLVWPTKAFAQLSDQVMSQTRAKAKSMLNAVNALPQLEQAEKLIARVPQAKWASDLHKIAKAWRAEILQYTADNFPALVLTSAFMERLQSSWSLENLQDIVAAVKLEYGASRAGYALEVYLALQRLQAAAAGEAVVEAEEVQTLLDDLKDHCWNYILRNWHLLQRTPTFKTTLPVDARQRLTAEVKDSLINITNLESPGDNSQSTGFSVLWDASNTQDNPTGTNALGPDGKRPVSKATEKRRQRLLEQQLQQQRQYEMEQQKARRAKFRQDMADARKSSSAAAAGSSTAETASDANLHRQDAEVPVSRQQSLSGAERPLPQQANAATPARQSSAATQQTGSSASASARRASRPSRDVTAQPSAAARCQSQTSAETRTIATVQTANSSQVSRRQSAPDLAATSQNSRPSSRTHSSRPSASIPRPGVQRQAAAAGEDLHMQAASGEANLHAERDGGARQPSADLVERSGQNGPGQIRPASSQVSQQHQPPVRSCSQLQQLRRLSLDSKPRFR